jgi:hypothetical protein
MANSVVDLDTVEARQAFQEALYRMDTVEDLVQLRLGLEERRAECAARLSQARQERAARGVYLPPAVYAGLERNMRVLGLRMQQVQVRLAGLRQQRRAEAERETSTRLVAMVGTDRDGDAPVRGYLAAFHHVATQLLHEDTLRQLDELTRERLAVHGRG